MVKFLITLAEMFSALSAKLHDMSEDMPNSVTLTHDDVIDIVQESIREGHIKLPNNEDAIEIDDIYGLDRFVTNEIDTYDFGSVLDRRQFEEQTMNLVLTYAFEHRLDTTNISREGELDAMRTHMNNRWNVWAETRKERNARKEAQILSRSEECPPCPPCPHVLHIKTDVEI